MISSAPIDRTRSTFDVLHTPVTCAPNALASCTANEPTPPAAPMIKTFCPGRHLPYVPQPLESGVSGDRNGRCLFESEVRRLARDPIRSGSSEIGERAFTGAEHLITRRDTGHVLTDRHHRSREGPARERGLWARGTRSP